MAKDILAEAVQHHEAGNLKKAERLYKNVLKANPRNSVALNLLGVLNYQGGRHSKAIQLLGKAVAISPDYAFAHFNLGNVYKYRGKLLDAEAAFKKVVALTPGDAGAQGNLGIVLQEQGRYEDAAGAFEKAVAIEPNNPEAQFNLANALLFLGREDAAKEAFHKALQLRPDYAEAHANLGNLHSGQSDHQQAMASFKQALALNPELAEAHANLGFVQKELHRFDEAVAACRRATKIRPDLAEAHTNLANALFQQEDLDGAVAALDAALALDPDDLDTVRTLASLWERANRLDQAREVIARGLNLAPEDDELNLLAAKCERRDGDIPAAIVRLEKLDRTGAPERSALNISYELGRLHDQQGDSNSAHGYFIEANQRSRDYPAHAKVNKNLFLDMIASVDAALSKSWIESWGETPALGERVAPVFFFGFPRSGTTLIDQVLAAHPDINILDEQPAIDAALSRVPGFPESYPSALADLTAPEIEQLRTSYFETADGFLNGGNGGLMIDKMPLNIVHVAMIWRLFPHAKMIFALRHPFDVCLSCFMQNFEIGPAMANFFSLEDSANLYSKAMALWQKSTEVLPLDCHTVKYEDFVDDFESETRALLKFLGVEWHEPMLDYTEHAKKRARIATVSYDQVVEPIYQRSQYRWKRYRNEIGTSLDGLKPWAKKFGYDVS